MSHSELWRRVKELVELALQFDVDGKLRRRDIVKKLDPDSPLLTAAREIAATRRGRRPPSDFFECHDIGLDEPESDYLEHEGSFIMTEDELESELEDAFERGVEYGSLKDDDDL